MFSIKFPGPLKFSVLFFPNFYALLCLCDTEKLGKKDGKFPGIPKI